MSQGVANHPERDTMESLWKEGKRAKDIILWLEEQGLPVVAASTLARYGQRYWSEKLVVKLDDLEGLDGRVQLMEEAFGPIKKIAIRNSVLASGAETSTQTIEVTPYTSAQISVERAAPVKVTVKYQRQKPESKPDGWKLGVFLPDMQIGYWGESPHLTTSHDEAAIDVAHQVMAAAESKYGIDLVVNAGDNLDFPAFSSHRSPLADNETTQMAIDRASREAATQRAIAPDGRIVWLSGNHDCLDDQTMAMTPDGPIPYTEVSVGDLVLSCADDLTAEWVRVEAVHEYDFDGEMIGIGVDGNHRVDMLVTPNHRVVGFPVSTWERHSKRYWKEHLAANYNTTCIPTAFTSGNKEVDLSDEIIRLIAWCLTDSHISSDYGYWTFYQSGGKAQRIRDLLDDLGILYGERRRARETTEICGKVLKEKPLPSYEFSVSAEDSRWICKFIDSKAYLPEVVRQFSDRQFDVFLEELVFTDGTIPTSCADSRVVYVSGPLKTEIQRECIRHGWSCTLTEYRPGHWRLNLSNKLATRMEKQFANRYKYTGKVWCLTVPHGRFVAYRNNKPFLTGNSRIINYLVDKAPPIVGLRRTGEEHPAISIPNLCRFDDYDIEWLEPYPDAELWVNDHLRFEHGSLYSSTPGGTAAKQLRAGVSVGYGHCHHQEFLQETRHTAKGPRTHFAGSPGCLARTDGATPSAKTGLTSRGKQSVSHCENWQQGLWVFWYQEEGDQLVSVEPLSIWGGWCMWRGMEFFASCDPNGKPQ